MVRIEITHYFFAMVTPLDQWEFFIQKLDEGIQKTRHHRQALISCLAPVPFPISCTAKTQLNKSETQPLQGLASQANL